MNLFKRETKLVEIEKGTKLPQMNADLRESLKTLQHNHAFNYVLMKLRFQKAMVQSYLNEGFQLSEKEIRYLQAGVYWLNFIEHDIEQMTKAPAAPISETPFDVQSEFDKVHANLEKIGG